MSNFIGLLAAADVMVLVENHFHFQHRLSRCDGRMFDGDHELSLNSRYWPANVTTATATAATPGDLHAQARGEAFDENCAEQQACPRYRERDKVAWLVTSGETGSASSAWPGCAEAMVRPSARMVVVSAVRRR